MGKKRTATIQGEGDKKKKEMFRWEEAYNDLPIHIATSLREARVKPDQLRNMPDGEVLAIEGVHSGDLNDIRAKYSPELATKVGAAVSDQTQEVASTKPATTNPRSKYPRQMSGRSSRYKDKKLKVENKTYSLSEAIILLRQISYSKLRTIELHLNTKETGIRGEVTLPHSIGKQLRVVIFSPEVETEIKAGKINFDILLARPSDMATIAPLARFLGPKGLMPNPKTGTITDKPEIRAQQLQKGSTLSYKTEAKSPLIHLTIGNLNQENKQIEENIMAILTGIGIHKLNSTFLKSTMSPSIKLDLTSL